MLATTNQARVPARSFFAALLLAPVLLLQGCTTNPPVARSVEFEKRITARGETQTLAMVDSSVEVFEIAVGGSRELVPDWSKAAQENVERSLRQSLASLNGFKLNAALTLTAEEKESLSQHVALFAHIAPDAFQIPRTGLPAWAHKRDNFDYTLGPGLKFLSEKYNSRYAIFAIAEDNHRSAGNKALTTVAVIGAAALGVIVIPSAYPAIIGLALVDTATGDISWLNYAINAHGGDLRKAEDAEKLVQIMLEPLVAATKPDAK